MTWVAGGNGLHFGRHGAILSSGKFKAANAPADAPCSLEIWFEPDLTAASATLFAFYAPGNPRQFSLNQSITDLAMQSDIRDGRYRTLTTRLFYVEDIFRRGKPLFVADVITNTLGTCFGVWLYRLTLRRVLFAKIWTHLVGKGEFG